jgi:CDP-diacylglycerol--serine O-phosphatidyltransferase
MGRVGWLAGFLFMVCGALRLARFNTQVGKVSSDHFVGLPIPAAAGMTAATVLLWHKLGLSVESHRLLILILLYVLAFLMVSTVRYYSFKNAELFHRRNFNVLVAAILLMIFVAAQPSITLFALGLTYVISGPLLTLWHYRKLKAVADRSKEAEDQRTSP